VRHCQSHLFKLILFLILTYGSGEGGLTAVKLLIIFLEDLAILKASGFLLDEAHQPTLIVSSDTGGIDWVWLIALT
jgi:hypothetical protein